MPIFWPKKAKISKYDNHFLLLKLDQTLLSYEQNVKRMDKRQTYQIL